MPVQDNKDAIAGIDRRRFLQSAAAGTVLVLGLDSAGHVVFAADAPAGPKDALGPRIFDVWLQIGADNSVTFYCPETEFGQGVTTSLAVLIAEELEPDWPKFVVVQGGTASIYNNPNAGRIATIGSNSTRSRFKQMRRLGAMTREMLKAAAAQQWNVPAVELTVSDGTVVHAASKRSASYGSLSAAAAKLSLPPETIALKAPEQWRMIGQPRPRMDSPVKCTGRAKYAVDLRLPGMLHAEVLRSPVLGGSVKSVDGSAALARKGVKAVENLGYGVAVVAEDSWTARRALEDLKVVWDDGRWAHYGSAEQAKDYAAAIANTNGYVVKTQGDFDAAAKLPGARVVEIDYTAPHLHHMCMEPQVSTVHVHDGVCEAWTPTNGATGEQHGLSFLLKLPLEKVVITRSEFVGGSFGRRDRLDQDMEAAQLSARVGAPVQVVQRRENDVKNGFYRPYQKSKIRGVIDSSGKLIAWHQKLASQGIGKKGHDLVELGVGGVDMAPVDAYLKEEGGPYLMPFDFFSVSNTMFNAPYALANLHVETIEMEAPARPTYWRSVGQTINTWQMESALDEMAGVAKVDPIAFRRPLLAAHPRGLKVLDEFVTFADWKYPQTPVVNGNTTTAWGMAFANTGGAYGAIGVQVAVSGKKLGVKRVVVVSDVGFVVNPNGLESQIQGGIIDGLATAFLQEITLKDGRVQQSNWGDYPTFHLKDAPQVDIKLLEARVEPMGSMAEFCTPLVIPAFVNAVCAATGTRIRELPLTKAGFSA
jgi:isoquinoline 1-oxidoreductase beta subunit